MIHVASHKHTLLIRSLWKLVFRDTEPFLELYFKEMYKPEQTVVSMEGDVLCATMQLLPYDFVLHGEKYKAVYIFAVMTAPAFRNQGHMKRMFEFALKELAQRDIDFVFLIPQTPDLIIMYDKLGFTPAFKQSQKNVQLPLSSNDLIIPSSTDAYAFYNKAMQNKASILQSKSQFDFITNIFRQEGGELYAVYENQQIQAFCFVLPQLNELRILDLVCVDDKYSQLLLGALHTKYKVDTAVVSTYVDDAELKPNIAMVYILQPTKISLTDLDHAYLSLMMNE